MRRKSDEDWEEGQLFVFGDDGEVLPYTEAPSEPPPEAPAAPVPEPEETFEVRARIADAPRSAEAFLAERSERPARTNRRARKSEPADPFEFEYCNDPEEWERRAKEMAEKKGRKRPKRSLKMRAAAALARREYTRKALREKLLRGLEEGETEADVDEALNDMERWGYLSDERFAKVRARNKASVLGDRRIREELRREGVAQETAKIAMNEIAEPENVRCYRLWKRRFGELPADRKEREKQIRYLLYRGFSMSSVDDVLRGRVIVEEEEVTDWGL